MSGEFGRKIGYIGLSLYGASLEPGLISGCKYSVYSKETLSRVRPEVVLRYLFWVGNAVLSST